MSKDKNIPKIRFPGFDGEWEQKKLGELYTERNENGNESLPFISVSIHSGVSDRELEDEELGKFVKRSDDKSKYKHVYEGDLVFNMMRAWQGAIGVAKSEGMISPAYISAIPNEKIYPLFMDYALRRDKVITEINNLSYGVTDFRKRLYWGSFVEVGCFLPSTREQKSIYKFFKSLDTLLSLHQNKCETIKWYKTAMLQKMFPREGKRVPEIRFPGFTGDWEQRKLGDVAHIIGGNAWKSNDYSDTGEYLVVTIANVSGDVFINDVVGNHLSCDNPEGYLLKENDILISLTGNVGRVSKMTRIKGLLNQRVGKITSKSSDINADFLFHVLRNPRFERAMIDAGQGAAQKNISNSDVLNYDFLFPVDKKEQASIARCFDELDNLITLHQHKCEEINEYKKGLLQQMFV